MLQPERCRKLIKIRIGSVCHGACCNFKRQPATLKGCQCARRGGLPGLGAFMIFKIEDIAEPLPQPGDEQAGIAVELSMGRHYDKIQIVTIKEMLENGKRLDIPLSLEVLKKAPRGAGEVAQTSLIGAA
jgi:hypothetical protein